MKYDREGHCVQKADWSRSLYNDGTCCNENHNEGSFEYNSHGDITKKHDYFLEFFENYQYDIHGNWIRYDYYANRDHKLLYTYERTIKYYE